MQRNKRKDDAPIILLEYRSKAAIMLGVLCCLLGYKGGKLRGKGVALLGEVERYEIIGLGMVKQALEDAYFEAIGGIIGEL